MVRRLASSLLLVWIFGFLWFAIALPQPVGDARTDAVVVLTGGRGRIERGLELLRRKQAARMLVSGVDREVRPREFAAEYRIDGALLRCCITLGYESVDTRSNARETAHWIAQNRIGSIRLVTSDWHMRRAAYELALVTPPGVTVIEDAVATQPSFYALFLEYHKLIARVIQRVWEA